MTALPVRIQRLIDVGDCWTWTGYVTNLGYGRVWANGKASPAHRVVYELLVGPIPADLTIDHLCKNTRCVNPDHLEAVTMRENVIRGTGPSAVNAAKTHCMYGHPFDEANTYLRRDGRGRQCRACRSRRYEKTMIGDNQ